MHALIFLTLLCLICIQIGETLQQSSHRFDSSGYVNYDVNFEIIFVGFENPEDFETPEDPATGFVWACQSSWASIVYNRDNPDAHEGNPYGHKVFEPAEDISHSGQQSARLALLDPSYAETDYRIHIYHQWDNASYEHIWFEAWYYIPLNLTVDNWTHFHQAISERAWTTKYELLGLGISITKASKVAEGQYKLETILNHGWVDNNNDSVNDLGTEKWVFSQDPIKFGEWFKITTYIRRDMDPTQGIYRCWINDVLQWDLRCRTIGILPERINSLPKTGGGDRGWVETGLSLYTGDYPNVTPKEIRVDDVVLKHSVP